MKLTDEDLTIVRLALNISTTQIKEAVPKDRHTDCLLPELQELLSRVEKHFKKKQG